MKHGSFVVIEGPDGVGKTTLISRLTNRLQREGVDCVAVREPGGTPAAEFARRGAFDGELHASPRAELFFFLAARADLVDKVIRPALSAGKFVLSDRYELSTFAYQVAGRQLPAEAVRAANALATGGLKPDMTLILDLPVDAARERQDSRGGTPDRLEGEAREFHHRVTDAFLGTEGPGVYHIDASGLPEEVEEKAWDLCASLVDGTMAGPAGST